MWLFRELEINYLFSTAVSAQSFFKLKFQVKILRDNISWRFLFFFLFSKLNFKLNFSNYDRIIEQKNSPECLPADVITSFSHFWLSVFEASITRPKKAFVPRKRGSAEGVQSRSPGHCHCQSGRSGSTNALTLGLGLRMWPARGVHRARGLLLLTAAGACGSG